jgi:hypothetical protein
MSVVEMVTAVTAVVAALGGGTGIASVISAVRGTKHRAKDVVPTRREPVAAAGTPGTPPYGVHDGASWSVGLGVLACLLAGTLVVVAGATTTPLDATWIMVLKWTVVAVAVAAIAVGGWSGYRPRKPGRELLAVRVSAGFLAACGALVATLIAGIS